MHKVNAVSFSGNLSVFIVFYDFVSFININTVRVTHFNVVIL